MQKILIDSAILGVPNYATDADEAEKLLGRVIHLADICRPSLPVQTLINAADENEIWQAGLGPDYGEIIQFMDMVGLSEIFSPADLTTAYHAIFQFSERVDRHPLSESLEEVQIQPELPTNLGPSILAGMGEKCLLDVAFNRGEGKNHILFSSLFDTAVQTVSIIYNDYEQQRSMQITAPLMYTFSDMISSDMAHSIWENMTTPQEAALAIMMEAHVLRKDAGIVDIIDTQHFSVGGAFDESLRANEASGRGRYAGSTLSLCAQIVAGTCAREIKPFGKPSQKKRASNDLAYRVHVTKAGVGVRLLLWNNGRRIEFANIGPKFELEIRDQAPSHMLSIDWKSLLN